MFRKQLLKIFFSLMILIVSSPIFAQSIRIGLASGLRSATVTGSNLVAVDQNGKTQNLGSKAVIKTGLNSVVINGSNFSPKVQIQSQGYIRYGKKAYAGAMTFPLAKGKFSVVNQLDLEEYLRGILKMEANPTWPLEALKAQAIISRTYALRNMGRFEPLGYDLDDTVISQVYGGANAYDPRCDRAIRETRGQVLTYQGEFAQTFFHADSGGATANVGDVWSESLPYLYGVPDPFPTNSRAARWSLTLTSNQLGAVLSKMGQGIGSVSRLVIVNRDPFGRPVTLRFEGSKGKATVKASAFRSAVGPTKLKSTFFAIDEEPVLVNQPTLKPQKPQDSTVADDPDLRKILADSDEGLPEVTLEENQEPEEQGTQEGSISAADSEAQFQTLVEQGQFSRDELIDLLLNPDKKAEYVQKALNRGSSKAPQNVPAVQTPYAPWSGGETVYQSKGGKFHFIGRGTGHGVGLSQWECKVMADNGWKAEQILEHFYPGTSLEQK